MYMAALKMDIACTDDLEVAGRIKEWAKSQRSGNSQGLVEKDCWCIEVDPFA